MLYNKKLLIIPLSFLISLKIIAAPRYSVSIGSSPSYFEAGVSMPLLYNAKQSLAFGLQLSGDYGYFDKTTLYGVEGITTKGDRTSSHFIFGTGFLTLNKGNLILGEENIGYNWNINNFKLESSLHYGSILTPHFSGERSVAFLTGVLTLPWWGIKVILPPMTIYGNRNLGLDRYPLYGDMF